MFDSSEQAWKDIELFLNGVRVGKVKKVSYKATRDTEHLYGAGDEPFDLGTGNKAYEGELTVYKSVVDKMNAAAQAASPDADLTDVPWTATICYKKTVDSPRTTVTLPKIVISEFSEGGENNNKALETTLPFKCLKPVRIFN